MYKGELISLSVAFCWTICAMFAEVASKRLGALVLNVLKMALSLLMFVVLLLIVTGKPYPSGAGPQAWLWLSLSGLVGYVLGDYCLFNSYIHIGARYGQLLMTLAPPAAAITGWFILGESLPGTAILAMIMTVGGIALSLYRKPDGNESGTPLPLKGILLGAGAGICQGIGLVLSAKGIDFYEQSAAAAGITENADIIPFASTMIRAITGFIGFTAWTLLSGHGKDLSAAFKDGKGMGYATAVTVFGPFVGVSLSLMATLYTNAGIAQTIMALVPVLIILPTYLFFHQKVRLREIIGAIIAVSGVSLFFIS